MQIENDQRFFENRSGKKMFGLHLIIDEEGEDVDRIPKAMQDLNLNNFLPFTRDLLIIIAGFIKCPAFLISRINTKERSILKRFSPSRNRLFISNVHLYIYVCAILLFSPARVMAQDFDQNPPILEGQLENLSSRSDQQVEDDSIEQLLKSYHNHPLNINTASEEELQSLHLLSELQIKSLIRYRILMGKLISIYELQAVPLWDIQTIRNLLPFITVRLEETLVEKFRRRWKAGDRLFLIRISQFLERSQGLNEPTDSSSARFLGSPQRIYFRYTYNYKNLLQYGVLGDKDAGEQFFRGYQKSGFDFYSYHFFFKNTGIIRAFALGDYTINMGQGLIQWQTITFTKSAGVLAIKRLGPILKPYHSAGEFNFHRGLAINLQKSKWSGLAFFSSRAISANIASDSLGHEDYISSFSNSGYHRTIAENLDKNNTREISFGGNISFSQPGFHIGLNGIHFHFSNNIQKQALPYNLFAIRGRSLTNYSLDYSATVRNFHLFGEFAFDKNGRLALVNGILMSLSSNVDAALLYRGIDRKYHSIYSDAFTESTETNNEKGIYGAISIRPAGGWKLDAFFDLFSFPWLKYRVDAPSYGHDYFVQILFQNSKNWNLYTRFRWEAKQANNPDSATYTHPLVSICKQSWRTELTVFLVRNVLISKTRIESDWYQPKQASAQQGFLTSFDIVYHSFKHPYAGNARLQYFETDGYESRIYAFENDVDYSFSMPDYYEKGFRYYININLRLKPSYRTHVKKTQWDFFVRWAQTIYPGKTLMSQVTDEKSGIRKSEIKFQFVLSL